MQQQRSPEPVGQVCEECAKKKKPPKPPQRVRAGLFFDGTGNNRLNAGASKAHLSWVDRNSVASTSYGNAESNVSKLEKRHGVYSNVTTEIWHYVEGIGTQSGGRDIPEGLSLGTGYAGVKQKVQIGYDALISDLFALDKSRVIEFIHIDSFGFSRGGAAARYLVHLVLADPTKNIAKRMADKGYTVNEVKVQFVGLYDTVASFGVVHKNDTRDLELDAIKNAEYTYQLAAGEEHRKNFRLTDIQSAKAGRQVFLPGVHSDIGGGYNDGDKEDELQVLDVDMTKTYAADKAAVKRGRQWFVDTGWYKDTDDELSDANMFWEVHGSRASISSKYSNLPLNIMAKVARRHGVNFQGSLATKHAIPSDPVVDNIRKAIRSTVQVGNRSKGKSWRNYWLHLGSADHGSNYTFGKSDIGALRHKYLHFSSYYGGPANPPQWTSNPVTGKRQRIVQKG